MIGNQTEVKNEAGLLLPSELMGKIAMSNYVVFLYETSGENDGTRMFLMED